MSDKITPPQSLNTAVLFLIFNRADTAIEVLKAIKEAKPLRLYIAADGPRVKRTGEAEKVISTRDLILQNVDWDCEVKTLFRDRNLGCKYAVSGAIDWFFENEDMGIILEDDCLPNQSFFRFCEEMLERFRSDQRIGMISGDNFQFGNRRNNDSYYFSKYVHIWGWATWRDRWQESYDVELKKWPKIRDEWITDILSNADEAKTWTNIFESTYQSKIDTWDYQWVFANWIEGRMNVIPNINLVSNIGFGAEATHTVREDHLANLVTHEMLFPLKHPLGVFKNLKADINTYRNCVDVPIYKKILNRLLKTKN